MTGSLLRFLTAPERGPCDANFKRLEEGIFAFPDAASQRSLCVSEHGLQIRAADLAMLLDGVDLATVKRSKRYQRRTVSALMAQPAAS